MYVTYFDLIYFCYYSFMLCLSFLTRYIPIPFNFLFFSSHTNVECAKQKAFWVYYFCRSKRSRLQLWINENEHAYYKQAKGEIYFPFQVPFMVFRTF